MQQSSISKKQSNAHVKQNDNCSQTNHIQIIQPLKVMNRNLTLLYKVIYNEK